MVLYPRIRLRLVVITLMLVAAALQASSQTTEELSRKYKLLDANHYQVRPDAILTVKTTSNGQICEMILKPKTVFEVEQSADQEKVLPQDLLQIKDAETIMSELVPDSRRGRLIKAGFSFESGCNEITIAEYDNVVIERVFHHCQKQFGEVVSITVQWKEAKCSDVIKRILSNKQ